MKELRGQMKPVSEMTDQELNEWVAMKVMGWYLQEEQLYHFENQFTGYASVDMLEIIPLWDPCNNLNHAYLMEEKILNGSQSSKFYYALTKVILNEELDTDELYLSAAKDLIHATARQRCEAAYLVLSNL